MTELILELNYFSAFNINMNVSDTANEIF